MRYWSALLLMAILGAGVYWHYSAPANTPSTAEIAITRAMDEKDTQGFERVYTPREFVFPRDHGPHPAYRMEWWYFTGNLATTTGRDFGYELTFFRVALAPQVLKTGSAWRASQMYLAHLALTDVAGKQFYSYERASRGALDLAGAKEESLQVWLEDWTARASGLDAGFPLRLQAVQYNIAIDLTLTSAKSMVPQGEQGVSQKSPMPGNASYYYSGTRLPTTGVIMVAGERFEVQGNSWLDREWGTTSLDKDQTGWDWFALQLSDQREIMFYRLRRRDGGSDPLSAGTLVDADGKVRRLQVNDVNITGLAYWQSSHGGARYPALWEVAIPSVDLKLRITPLLADQELNVSVRYWEGAVKIEGRAAGTPISGKGYVELTGYTRRP